MYIRDVYLIICSDTDRYMLIILYNVHTYIEIVYVHIISCARMYLCCVLCIHYRLYNICIYIHMHHTHIIYLGDVSYNSSRPAITNKVENDGVESFYCLLCIRNFFHEFNVVFFIIFTCVLLLYFYLMKNEMRH